MISRRLGLAGAGAVIGLATVCTSTAATAAASSAPHHSGGKGTIRVTVIHNYGADHAKGRKICALATTKKHDKILGKCDTANAKGLAILKHVPAGKCTVGAYNGFEEPYTRAKHNIHVHAGKTTKYTFHLNEIVLG